MSNNKKHKYIQETIPVIIRMTPKLRDKWKMLCLKEKVTYKEFIENRIKSQVK